MNDIKTIISDSPHFLINNNSFSCLHAFEFQSGGFNTNHSSNFGESAPLDIVDSLQEFLGKTR